MSCLYKTIILLLSIPLILNSIVFAEPVLINQGNGQGFLFSHNGNCFVILPAHVHGRSRAVSIGTAAPSAFGDAKIMSFRSKHDLSIGFVSAGLEKNCQDKWVDLPNNINMRLGNIENATLKRISSSGLEERLQMRIVDYDYDTITARVVDGNEIFKGTSGGILMAENVPIGMAIESPDSKIAIFLRMDEIKAELSRLIDAQAQASPASTKKDEINKATDNASNGNICPKSTIPIKSISCDKEPTSAEAVCSGLRLGQAVTFPTTALPVNIIVEFDNKEPVIVSEVQLNSKYETSATAVPKSIKVMSDSSMGESRRWRTFGFKDMSPDGQLTLINGARPYAKRMKILIFSSWAMDKDVKLNCLSIR